MEYKTVKLKDIASITMGQSPKGSSYNKEKKGMPFLQGNKTFGRLYPSIETWTTEPTKIGKKGTVLMSVRAPVGDLNIANQDVCIGRGLCSIEMKNEKNEYLYYLLKNAMKEIKRKSTGTVFASINKKELEEIKVIDFNEKEQIKIAKVLSNIDKKIELNNQINNNLLELCKKIFEEWFVNYNFPENNEKMKDSILGKIPNDWKICKVQEIAKIKRGASPRPIQNYISNNGVNWLKISDVTGIKEPFIYNIKEKIKEEGKEKSCFIKKGTLVISNSATPGIPKFIEIDTCVHDGWLVLYDYKDYYKYFIYFLILNIRNKLLSLSNGSVFQNLKTDILKQFEFVNPTKTILIKYSEIVEPLMNKVKQNCEENTILEQINETLLPKLMKGEIDIDKIEI